MRVVALSGGVGGAKLVEGLSHVVSAEDLSIIVNTADDEEFDGLYVSPDLDIVMYTLAGLVNRETGWGVDGDTWNSLAMLTRYGTPTWFRLGDRDLATHILRTAWLREGRTLTEITAELCQRLSLRVRLLPMSDQRVRTFVQTDFGMLPFQEYFVKHRAEVPVRRVVFEGSESARPTSEVLRTIAETDALIVCPSNPIVSIAPILALRTLREAIQGLRVPRIGISPLVGGRALKGPTVQMMEGLGLQADAVGVAMLLRDVLDVFVIDPVDEPLGGYIEALGIQVAIHPIVMDTVQEKIRVAREVLRLASPDH